MKGGRSNGKWRWARDFVEDHNAPSRRSIQLSEDAERCVGTCGPRPDTALMLKEDGGILPFTNYIENQSAARTRLQRTCWLYSLIRDYPKTKSIPIARLTEIETRWIMGMLMHGKSAVSLYPKAA